MNELMTMESVKTMTSLEVAELTNKDHKNILADIRDEISKLGEERGRLIFQPSEYRNVQNKKQPMYNITLDGVLQLGARYDAVIRFNLIQRVKELQAKVKVPTTMKEALQIALDQQEEIEALSLQNKRLEIKANEDKPKLDYLNKILQSSGTLKISQVAADYNMSAIALNKLLHEAGLIRKVNDQWILYKKYMEKGYTDSETMVIPYIDKETGEREEKTTMLTVWTQKGRLKIHEILTELGIKANFDK